VARGRPLGRVSSLHLRPRAAGAPLAVARSLHDALPISRMDLRMFRQKQHVVEGQALADDPWAAIRIDHCSSRPWMREARGRLARRLAPRLAGRVQFVPWHFDVAMSKNRRSRRALSSQPKSLWYSDFGRFSGPVAGPGPCALAGAHAEARSIRGSHGDAENAEVWRAQRVGSGALALRRLRG